MELVITLNQENYFYFELEIVPSYKFIVIN
jgi:hypothetical protein